MAGRNLSYHAFGDYVRMYSISVVAHHFKCDSLTEIVRHAALSAS